MDPQIVDTQSSWTSQASFTSLLILHQTIHHLSDLESPLVGLILAGPPPAAVCAAYYSSGFALTSQSASLSANFIAFVFDFTGCQFYPPKWTEYEIQNEF